MKRCLAKLLALLACVSSYSALSDDAITNQLSYQHLYTQLSSGSLNENLGVNSNITALAIGGNLLISPYLVASLDYSARFIHPGSTTTEHYTFLPSVGYRFPVQERFDLFIQGSVGIQREVITQDQTDNRLSSRNEHVLGGSLSALFALDEQWSLTTTGALLRSDIADVDSFKLKLDYRMSPLWSLGGFYIHRDASSYTTNEGGINFQFHYAR